MNNRKMIVRGDIIEISWVWGDDDFSDIKDDVKGIGARWDSFEKKWTVPVSLIKKARRIAEKWQFSLSGFDEVEQKIAAAQSESRATDSSIEIPAPPGLSYLPYQKAGIAYAIKRRDALIADEMGLGKTIQAIGTINADPSAQRILVVCPASLKLNWQREAEKWLVEKRPIIVVSGGKTVEIPAGPVVVVVNYEVVGKHPELQKGWDIAIFDESHYLKNPKAARTKEGLGISAKRRLFLTGTPIMNRPIELFPILESVGIFGNYWKFAERYCDLQQTRYGVDVSGASNLSELQGILREKIMVRRLKKDVLTELPAKIRQQIVLDPEGRDEKAAIKAELEVLKTAKKAKEALKNDKNNQEIKGIYLNSLSEIAKARHSTTLVKVPRVVERVQELLESGEARKIIVFAHHRDVIDALKSGLSAFSPVSLTGEDSLEARQQAVDRFQTDPSCRVFIASIRAAGVGITLTAASTVIFAELDWTPSALSQAEDRAHRIGQTDSVLVVHILLNGSIDAKLSEKLIEKQKIIEKALDSQGSSPSEEPEEALVDDLLEIA